MIKINNITRGRFGNRILQVNSAYQLAYKLNTSVKISEWEGNKLFDMPNLSCNTEASNEERLFTWEDCNLSWSEIETLHDEFDLVLDDPAYVLHNTFYKLTHIQPREIFKFKKSHIPEFNDPLKKEKNTFIGIHVRGTDFRTADNGFWEHHFDFYHRAINTVIENLENPFFIICTEDMNYPLVHDIRKLLTDLNVSYELGRHTDLYYDFSILSHCDVLITSSSTFGMTAGILGMPDKKIIHSARWIKKSTNHIPWNNVQDKNVRARQKNFDNFWKDVGLGGNEFYKAWRIV